MADANSALKTTLGALIAKLAGGSLPDSSANDLSADRGYGPGPGARSERSASGWPGSRGGRH